MSPKPASNKTGGKKATNAVIPGEFALSVGKPEADTPRGWEWTKLTDVARLETGHTPSRKHPEYWGGDIPWIGIKDATENHGHVITTTYQAISELGVENSSARVLPKDTVCLSRTASVGYVVIMGQPMATSQDFVNWVCYENIDHRYLASILFAEKSSYSLFSRGTTHQTIYFPEVKAFHVLLPPIDEQRRISEVIWNINDKIRINSEINLTQEQIAHALFKSWFVDFEPVKAKMAALEAGGAAEDAERAAIQAISGKSEADLDSLKTENPEQYDNLARTAALFPSAMVESELGEIPEGWTVTQLGAIAENVRKSIKPSGMDPDSLYVGLEHIDRKSLALTRNGFAREVESNKSCFQKGDILFGKLRPYFHKVCMAPEQGICSTDILVIRPKEENLGSFVTFLCFLDHFVNYTNLHSSGTRMPRASWKDMANYGFVYPSRALLGKFEETVKPMLESQRNRTYEAKRLAELRDTLLPKLLSGELTVPDAEDEAPEAANA